MKWLFSNSSSFSACSNTLSWYYFTLNIIIIIIIRWLKHCLFSSSLCNNNFLIFFAWFYLRSTNFSRHIFSFLNRYFMLILFLTVVLCISFYISINVIFFFRLHTCLLRILSFNSISSNMSIKVILTFLLLTLLCILIIRLSISFDSSIKIISTFRLLTYWLFGIWSLKSRLSINSRLSNNCWLCIHYRLSINYRLCINNNWLRINRRLSNNYRLSINYRLLLLYRYFKYWLLSNNLFYNLLDYYIWLSNCRLRNNDRIIWVFFSFLILSNNNIRRINSINLIIFIFIFTSLINHFNSIFFIINNIDCDLMIFQYLL